MSSNLTDEWRSLSPSEQNIWIKYFEKQHNMIAKWFFTIWIWFGYIGIVGSIISYTLDTIKNGFNVFLIISLPFGLAMIYFFFIFLGKKLRDKWSKQKLNAIKNHKAKICDAIILDIKCLHHDNHYVYKVKTIVPDIPKPVYVNIDPWVAKHEIPGNTIHVVSYQEPKHETMMFAYTDAYLNNIQHLLNI